MTKTDSPRRPGITRRRFLQASAGIGLGLGFYTWRLEPHWIEFVNRDLPIRNLPKALHGTRLAQLSDLHIGPRVSDSYLLGVFDRVKHLAPDIVVYTGDFTSYEAQGMGHARRVLAHLPQGNRGTFGILGNHDYGPHWAHPEIAAQVAMAARDAGVQLLRNEMAQIEGLQIVGLDDLWAGRFQPSQSLGSLDPQIPSLVLSHNPDTADEPVWEDYQGWILSGHTHGGQCKPPFLPPPVLPVRNRRYISGEYTLAGGRRLYISRGIGHLLRVRFNVRPEVTLFRLTGA